MLLESKGDLRAEDRITSQLKRTPLLSTAGQRGRLGVIISGANEKEIHSLSYGDSTHFHQEVAMAEASVVENLV